MYLINTATLELRPFLGTLPPYVILSHTWGKGEVTFESMQNPDTLEKGSYGYRKIKKCCRQAKMDGYKWAWVDTCCIDKRSSAELSEAINSMYRYYWEADKCYAYLSDVCIRHEPNTTVYMSTCEATNRLRVSTKHLSDRPKMTSEQTLNLLEGSRWFKRGWTLQELLAPAVVELYDIHWTFLGTKSNLATEIGKITRINVRHLKDRTSIKTASIGLRFSWASRRETTREEDIAYCLLGIVEVNMPLLYGEGRRAFRRLQIELLKKTRDHTMFVWSYSNFRRRRRISRRGPGSFLAPSPTFFDASVLENVRPTFLQPLVENSVLEMTALGLHITVLCIRNRLQPDGHIIAILDCLREDNTNVGIFLEKRSDGRYEKAQGLELVKVSPEEVLQAVTKELYIIDEDLLGPDDVRGTYGCAFKTGSLVMEGISESNVCEYKVGIYTTFHKIAYHEPQLLMPNTRDFCHQVFEVTPFQLIGFAIKLRSMTITILGRDVDGHPWLRVVLGDDVLGNDDSATKEIEKLVEDFYEGISSEHLRDSVTAYRGTELRVDVHARRSLLPRGNKTLPCWQLAIHIRAGSASSLR